jgi:rhodanese-related sulfurtransferase
MKTYAQLVAQAQILACAKIMPWDLREMLSGGSAPLLLDVREPSEFALAHIAGALNVPRGVLEASCDWGYDETEPELVTARQRSVVVICRSGNRSCWRPMCCSRWATRMWLR